MALGRGRKLPRFPSELFQGPWSCAQALGGTIAREAGDKPTLVIKSEEVKSRREFLALW